MAGNKIAFTQISLFSVLLCGRYGGVTAIGAVKQMGNMAIATMDRLDGEVQMVDGVVYQACSDGSIRLPCDDETIPFGTVAQFEAQFRQRITGISSYQAFEAATAEWFRHGNIPLAVHVKGTFVHMKVRAVGRQEQDGVGLAEVAEHEAIFNLENVVGDLVGFRLPGYLKGVNAPGWHLHFMDDVRTCGGHVVNFALADGMLDACLCDEFRLHLPDCPQALDGLALAQDRSRELARAEAER